MNCTKIKRIIDEADRPDVFPLEAAGHVAACPQCRTFADERAKLRELTGSVTRVTAPGNFNALLNERLSRVKSQRSSWLSSAGFLRLGTATAGLLVVFVALQYGGFLSPRTPPPDSRSVEGTGEAALHPTPPTSDPSSKTDLLAQAAPANQGGSNQVVADASRQTPHGAGTASRASRTRYAKESRTPKEEAPQNDPSVLLVRDRNGGDRAYPMIRFSIGMQQQMMINASYGRPQPRTSEISY